MQRQYSWPDGHWNWPVRLTHKHGVKAGKFIFTGGQVDLDPQGNVRHPNDIEQQCASSMEYLRCVLVDLGCGFDDLVRLVVYFVGDAQTEQQLLEQIGNIIGANPRPVINMIGLPELCYPQMMIEIEGVAMRGEEETPLERTCLQLPDMPKLPSAFSHVVQGDGVIFTGDLSAVLPSGDVEAPGDVQKQTEIMMDQLGKTLAAVGADYDDVLKLNAYYVGDGTAENWETPARIRAGYFKDLGPTPTGMTVPYFPNRDVMTKIYVTAMRGQAGAQLEKKHVWPKGHWGWTTPLPYSHGTLCGSLIHVGGQVSLTAQAVVIHPGDMVAQTRKAMENVRRVLAEFGADLQDVVKVTTFYQGSASAEALHENLLVRSRSYTEPGPATTGIPMPSLIYKDMMIEIEVIAVKESSP